VLSSDAMQAKAPSPTVNPLMPACAHRHWNVGSVPQMPCGKLASIKVERQAVAHDGTKSTISLGRPMTVAVTGLAKKRKDDIKANNTGVVVPRDRDGIVGRTGHPTCCSASPEKGAPGLASVGDLGVYRILFVLMR
jgi:hypothetical protein